MKDKKREATFESETEEERTIAEEGTEEIEMEDKIMANFVFFDPTEADVPSMSQIFAQQFRDMADLDVTELANIIIQQRTVGTVIKCEEAVDEGDAFVLGLISVLNFDRYKDSKCITQIKQYILSNCDDLSKKAAFKQMFESTKAGLIVNERLLNVPHQVGPPLNQALFEEMDWGKEDEPTDELRASFKMEHFVILTHVYEQAAQSEKPNAGVHPTKKSKVSGPTGYIYVKPEDEFYHKFCKEWVTWRPSGESNRQDDFVQLRLAMVISREGCNQARFSLDSIVGNPANPNV